MNNPFINRLQQDARAIRGLADQRLKNMNLDQQLSKQLQQPQPTRWPWAVAAAVCLMVLGGVLIQPQLANQSSTLPLNAKVQPAMKLNWELSTGQLEQAINQPLINEQQAIMEDLKTLRKAMLSI